MRGDMINVYKILNNEKSDNKMLKLNTSKYQTRGHDKKLQKMSFKCNLRKSSFSLRVTNIWNSLNKSVTNASSIDQFKKLLDDQLKNVHYEID